MNYTARHHRDKRLRHLWPVIPLLHFVAHSIAHAFETDIYSLGNLDLRIRLAVNDHLASLPFLMSM
jgi:hypothetical protein